MPVFKNAWTRRAKRALSADWRAGGVVLLYHRVAELTRDPQQLAVSPRHFARHLEIVSRDGVVMALGEMVERARTGTLPARAVAITFDDGYADTLQAAAPELARRGVPASIFVSTGFAGGEFWWDALERMLLSPGAAGARVRLTFDGVRRDYQAGAALYHHLCERLRATSPAARVDLLAELEARLNADPAREADRSLTADQVAQLSAIDGLHIGSHTVSHGSLAHAGHADQRREIGDARRRLESWTGARVADLAFPFGGAREMSRAVVDAARDESIALACTTLPGRVHAGTDPMRVPRLIVRDWPEEEFLTHWRSWVA